MTELAPIEVGRIRITPLGLDFTNGDVTYEELETALFVLGRMRDATAFGIGDGIIFGLERFGEAAAQIAEATGRSPDTIARFVRVAGSIWRSRRHPALSWSHHELVARQRYSPEEQDEWLRRADEGRWSVGDLRSMLVAPPPIETATSPESTQISVLPPASNGATEYPGGADGGTASPVLIQPGHGVAGIDFDTYKATIAVIDFDATVCDVREVRFRKNTQSGTVEAYNAVKRLPRLLWDGFDWSAVGVAWIERGYGKGRNADWALGRVQGAITATLAGSFPVNEIAIQEWRKELTGMGQKPKHEMLVLQRKALADAGVTIRQGPEREPVSPSFAGLTDDELDAVSIAVVGREQNVRALAGAAS